MVCSPTRCRAWCCQGLTGRYGEAGRGAGGGGARSLAEDAAVRASLAGDLTEARQTGSCPRSYGTEVRGLDVQTSLDWMVTRHHFIHSLSYTPRSLTRVTSQRSRKQSNQGIMPHKTVSPSTPGHHAYLTPRPVPPVHAIQKRRPQVPPYSSIISASSSLTPRIRCARWQSSSPVSSSRSSRPSARSFRMSSSGAGNASGLWLSTLIPCAYR